MMVFSICVINCKTSSMELCIKYSCATSRKKSKLISSQYLSSKMTLQELLSSENGFKSLGNITKLSVIGDLRLKSYIRRLRNSFSLDNQTLNALTWQNIRLSATNTSAYRCNNCYHKNVLLKNMRKIYLKIYLNHGVSSGEDVFSHTLQTRQFISGYLANLANLWPNSSPMLQTMEGGITSTAVGPFFTKEEPIQKLYSVEKEWKPKQMLRFIPRNFLFPLPNWCGSSSMLQPIGIGITLVGVGSFPDLDESKFN